MMLPPPIPSLVERNQSDSAAPVKDTSGKGSGPGSGTAKVGGIGPSSNRGSRTKSTSGRVRGTTRGRGRAASVGSNGNGRPKAASGPKHVRGTASSPVDGDVAVGRPSRTHAQPPPRSSGWTKPKYYDKGMFKGRWMR